MDQTNVRARRIPGAKIGTPGTRQPGTLARVPLQGFTPETWGTQFGCMLTNSPRQATRPMQNRGKQTTRLFAATLALAAVVFPHTSSAQDMPAYQSKQQVSGQLTVWGDDALQGLMTLWAGDFQRVQPGVTFHIFLRGTSTAVGALYTGTAQIGLFGREIRPLEVVSWKRLFSYPPLGFTIATGSYDQFAKTVAVAVLVNRDNPLQRISLRQLDAIYSRDRRRGAPTRIHVWGQLGLTGAWANRPINVYGLDENTGTAQYFASRVLEEGRWNCDLELPAGAPQTMFRGSGGKAADALVEALQHDPYAIGIGGFRNAGSGLKALAVGEKDSGPFIQGTKSTVADRSYPLSRNIYLFVNKNPAKAWDPKVEEFLRFVLSRQGQAGVAEEGGYLPLPPATVVEGRKKIE